MQLKRRGGAAASDQSDAKTEHALENSPAESQKIEPDEEPQAKDSEVTPAKSGFDVADPFGEGIKAGEINDAAGNESRLTLESSNEGPIQSEKRDAPQIQKETQDPTEPRSAGIPPDEDPPAGKNSLLQSLLAITLLLVILAGCGFGIWWILKPSGSESEAASEAPLAAASTSEATSTQAVSGPIQRAKDTLNQLPLPELDAIKSTGNLSPVDKSPTALKTPAKPIEKTPPAKEAVTQTTSKNSELFEKSQQEVSAFLSDMHIGGLRQSANPMILIDGQNYQIGDIVHEATGLKFIGLRKERPAFRDRHGIVYLRSF